MSGHISIDESQAHKLLSAALLSLPGESFSDLPSPRSQQEIIHQLSSPWLAVTFKLPSDPLAISATLLTYEKGEDSESVEEKFRELVDEWKGHRAATSFSTQLVTHPAYQRIVGLGKPALPLILAELEKNVDHWFWALKAISGEDPVPVKSRGRLNEMAKAWIDWGKVKGYVR